MNPRQNAPASWIEDALSKDHEELDLLMSSLKSSLKDEPKAAREHLARFQESLAYHMDWEEKELFPAVIPHCTHAQRRSIESLKIDHERIRGVLNDLNVALSQEHPFGALEHFDDLRVYLEGHNTACTWMQASI